MRALFLCRVEDGNRRKDTMKHTSRPLEIKSFEETGVFEGYGSVFGNADWYGDVVMPGAFANSLARACGHEAWAIKQGT